MRRLLLPLALFAAALALPSSASAAYTLGVSDQQARVFSSPLFKPLKFKAARYIAPYDVMSSPADTTTTSPSVRSAEATWATTALCAAASDRAS